MTDYTWPSTVKPTTSSLAWMDNTKVFVSPLSGTVRTESLPGGRWSLSLTVTGLDNQEVNKIHTIEAFLFRLNGAEHRAVIPDPAYRRAGPGGGTPIVNGASQVGLTLSTSGWTPSITVLRAGDRIGVSNQMIPVVADVTANGSGVATISLAHPIRIAPTNGSAVEINAPTARYILTNKVSAASKPGTSKIIQVDFEEAIP